MKKQNPILRQRQSIVELESFKYTIQDKLVPLLIKQHRYSKEDIQQIPEERREVIERVMTRREPQVNQSTDLGEQRPRRLVEEARVRRAEQRAEVERRVAERDMPEEDPQHQTGEEKLNDALARVRELLRTVRERTANFYTENGRWFTVLLNKIEKTRETLNNKEVAAKAILEHLIETSKAHPDEKPLSEIDDNLLETANKVAEAYGLSSHMGSVDTVAAFRAKVEKLLESNKPVEKMIENIQYEIEPRHFKYFGYKRSLKVLSEEQMTFQKNLSSQFMKLALFARKEMHPQRLITAVQNFTKGKKSVNPEGFESFILEEIIQPFFNYDVSDSVLGNISEDNAIQYKKGKSVQAVFEENGKDIEAFRKALDLLIPEIIPAKHEERLQEFELVYDREIIIKYVQLLRDTANSAKMNRSHMLHVEGKDKLTSSMLDQASFEKLMRDNRLDPNSEAGQVLGQSILRINATMDDYLNQTYLLWAKINGIQVKVLNSQLNALNDLRTDVAKD